MAAGHMCAWEGSSNETAEVIQASLHTPSAPLRRLNAAPPAWLPLSRVLHGTLPEGTPLTTLRSAWGDGHVLPWGPRLSLPGTQRQSASGQTL